MASEQDLLGALRQADAAGDTQGAQRIAQMIKDARAQGSAPAAPQASPQDRAFAAGQAEGGEHSPLTTGLYNAADSALFGGGDYVSAATRYLAQRGMGVQNPDDFNTDLAYAKGLKQGTSAANPKAAVTGQIAGALAPGAAAEHVVAGGLGLTSRLALKAGQPVRNILRLVGTGAVAGGSYGAAHGAVTGGEQGGASGALTGAATGGAEGAVAGAAAGPVLAGGGYVASKLVQKGVQAATGTLPGLSEKAWALMADKLGTSPDTLATMADEFRASLGRNPTYPDILDAVSKANLKPVANAYQSSAAKMQDAATAEQQALPGRLSANIAAGGKTATPFGPYINVSRVADLRNEQDLQMNEAMGARDPTTKTRAAGTLGTQPVALPQEMQDFNNHPDVVAAKQEIPGLSGVLNRGLTLDKPYTVDDFDSMRQSLNKLQASVGASNSQFGDTIGQVRDSLVGLARQRQPAYDAALTAFQRQEHFIQGFKHASDGKSLLDVPDMGDIRVLKTPEGDAGMELGARSRLYQTAAETEGGAAKTADNLRQGAPSKVLGALPGAEQAALRKGGALETKAQQNYSDLARPSLPDQDAGKPSVTVGEAANVLAHGVSGGNYGAAHALVRIVRGGGVSENMANQIVDELTRVRTPDDVRALTTTLNRNIKNAQVRRLILKQTTRYTGVAGAVGARSVLNNEGQ